MNIKIMWGYNDRDDTTKGWFIKISDSLTGELWAEKLMDVNNIIEIRGSDVDYIHHMIDNLSILEDRCRLEKYDYDKSIEEINNLSPSDFG